MALKNMNWKKWTKWEFWPARLAMVPVYAMGLWLALRARNLLYFTNVNPAIPLSGAVGESKMAILKLLPPEIVPPTIMVAPNTESTEIAMRMQDAGIAFPVVAKPDVGERGFLITICEDTAALDRHLKAHPVPFLIQPFLQLPEEYALFFYRFPGGGPFGIHSICRKGFLKVVGDGNSTVLELMSKDLRASLQIQRFEKEQPELLQSIPALGEEVILEHIGNHIRGTAFLDARHLLNEEMLHNYKALTAQIKGVQFGRFDLKCASIEALQKGAIQVMEMNGVFGEPAHVYDPSFNIKQVYQGFWEHWLLIYKLHRAQTKAGIPTASMTSAIKLFREWKQYKKSFQVRP